MNLANKITIFRIFLIPILVLIPFLPIPEETFLGISYTMWCLAIIFSIGALSDKLDGYIARSRNMITNFGKFADPLADKILVISAMMMLVEFGKLPSWIVIIIIAREFIVSGYRLVAVSKENNVIAASIWGKLKTVLQLIAVIMLMLDPNSFGACFNGSLIGFAFVYNIATTIITVASVIATVFSGLDYMKDYKQLMND